MEDNIKYNYTAALARAQHYFSYRALILFQSIYSWYSLLSWDTKARNRVQSKISTLACHKVHFPFFSIFWKLSYAYLFQKSGIFSFFYLNPSSSSSMKLPKIIIAKQSMFYGNSPKNMIFSLPFHHLPPINSC